MITLKNKKVLVLGLARSGMAAINLLAKYGANITLNESKKEEQLDQLETLKQLNVRLVCGGQPQELFEEDFDLVIKNPGIKYTEWFILRLQERNIPIYTEIELAYQLAPNHHYLAVTGTNGKTTTVTLVYEILKAAFGSKAHFAGNIGKPLSEVVFESELDQQEGHYIVIEMSNFQLLNIEKFKPEVSTVINLTPDHLDYMRNLDEYYASKMRIYENCDASNIYINNLDDDNLKTYVALYPPKASVLSLSMNQEANYHLENKAIYYNDEFVMNLSDIQMVGRQNVQNVMIASSLTHAVGVSFEVIRDVISKFPGVEHRVEFVREIDGVKYYNDSKGTNTDATIVAVNSFECPIILLVGGKEKGLPMDDLKQHLHNVKRVIGYGDCGGRLVFDLVGENGDVVSTMDEAIAIAKRIAVSGDVILLSPTTSSFDQFTSFEHRGRYFKEIVNAL